MVTAAGSMIKRIILFFLKVIYILPFFVIGLWLISVVYFPGFDLNASISLLKYGKTRAPVGTTVVRKKEAVPRDHFHITDQYVERLDVKRQVCDLCHGVYAHGKDIKVRALLNLHTGFMACAVCHVRKDGGEGQGGATLRPEIGGFTWVDNDTGEFKSSVTGEYGKYSEMIFPVLTAGQGIRRIYKPISDSAARRFLEGKPEWTEKQLDEARLKLHEGISKEAVSCTDCHKKDGYFDFAALGYSKQRVDHLISSEVVGMIENYKTFYLPSVVDFRGE
jgi:hypothetical protein